jgi:tetratricopeptide (TPR) repeat protein
MRLVPTRWLRTGILVLAVCAAAGCRKGFEPYYEKARRAFDNQNDIEAVDALQLGLPRWHSSDGVEAKAQAYQLLGQAYHRLRNTDKAIAAYRQAIQLSSSTFESARALGQLLLARGQHEAAMRVLQRSLQMRPGDPEALLGLGNAYYMLHRTSEARQSFQQVLDNSPAVREAMEALKAMDRPSDGSRPSRLRRER